ncbi:SDR family oxidoreductase [Chryseobacterium sp. POL2]|uniref:SDR family oxidoreductase n=1 Tax=Chryseobacterium sp. POL2 TaxID=2713414 RepID=UPI0013E0FDE6|nr:SDR family oxidoreductase [Chryseobacterium sp. POL2]QIG88802.1 SDR family oxidoreductase [Chryseobacterium sp. POL2]
MSNKVAYITGGTKGVGFGIAEVLLKNGFKVAFSGRKPEDVDKAATQLDPLGEHVLGIVSDVKNFGDEQQAISKTLEKFGKIDLVVANAGLGHFASVDELSIEDWHEMIDTNLTGVFYTLKSSIEALKKTEGYFISIASLAGEYFFEKGSGYNASKFGVVGFTQAAMIDLRKFNIKCAVILPGSINTYFNNSEPKEEDAWKIQPSDVGDLIINMLNMDPRVLPSKIELRASQVKK